MKNPKDNLHPSRTFAHLSLLAATAVWGITFAVVKDGIANFPVFCFLFLRFGSAALILGLAMNRRLKVLDRAFIWTGIKIGFWLFLGYFLQTWGLKYTSASNSGFITGLFVVFTPIVAYFYLKRRIEAHIIVSVVIAAGGLLLLSFKDVGLEGFSGLNLGDLLTLFCAFAYAVQISMIDKHSPGTDAGLLTLVQLATVGLLSGLLHLVFEELPSRIPTATWEALIITSLFGTVFAIWVQARMQRYTTPTRTALIFITEPLFAAIFAFILRGENIGLLGYLGGGLIFISMVLAEIQTLTHNRRKTRPPPLPKKNAD